jgi:hypothetical protein
MLHFIIYVIILACMFMGIFLYMLHIYGYCYLSIKLYITECNCFLCLYVKLLQECCMYMFKVACSLKRKFMWHSSVDYWVCYRMFHSKRMKAFPRVAWPSLFKARDVTNWCQSMRYFSGVAFPGLSVVGERYKLVLEPQFQH